MQPADNPAINYKDLVRIGYDRCAGAYEAARHAAPACPHLAALIDRLPYNAAVLDIGCGAGVPIAQTLAAHAAVTGVDLSAEQIRRARHNVPGATFVHGDIMAQTFEPTSFDAVIAWYVIFHLPREEHAPLLTRIRHWVRPGGWLLATVTTEAEAPYTEEDFFGVTMYWSNHSLADYRRMLADTGWEVFDTTATGHGYNADATPPEHHPVLLARAV